MLTSQISIHYQLLCYYGILLIYMLTLKQSHYVLYAIVTGYYKTIIFITEK